jgi:folate-binding protein YgfZ
LRVSGADALSFLQGQYTNDLHHGPAGGATYGIWLNQKGRVVADSFVRKISPEELWLVSYFSPATVIRERLEAYIVADEVVIEDVTDSTRGLTIWGVAAAGAVQAPAWSFQGRRSREPHSEIIFPASAEPGMDAGPAGGVLLSAGEMERERIAAGIPAVPVDLGLADLPNEGGLEAEAISYTKGCYLGQEVMARLKSMGQVRRRLLRVGGTGEPPPRPAALFQAAQKIGELRSAAREGAGWIGLAMITLVPLRRDEGLAVAAGGAPVVRLVATP